jgi:hypothetical protein
MAVKNKKKGTMSKEHLTRIQRLFPNVKIVKDATEPIAVEVTARHNKQGTMKDPEDCAMARACKEVYGLDGVIISLSKAYLVKGDVAIRYEVPTSLRSEVISFDRNHTFEPGVYSLSPITAKHKLGSPSNAGGPHKTKDPSRKAFTRHITTNVRKFPNRVIGGEAKAAFAKGWQGF